MNLILTDIKPLRENLLPFTFTRPVGEIRVGILTIAEKWKIELDRDCFYLTEGYLAQKFPLQVADYNLIINGAVCPTLDLIQQLHALKPGQALIKDSCFLGGIADKAILFACQKDRTSIQQHFECISYDASVNIIKNVWDIFLFNAAEIASDFQRVTKGRTSQKIVDKHTSVYGLENIFVEEGASIKAAILNAESGPIYIGKNAQIGEGAIIKGAFALCEGATVNMGAKIRGDVTVGPYSKVGGEISNSVLFGYSNKGHDGFLGNSVLGEWCNMGADSNVSNLKNNYSLVKLWNYAQRSFIGSGQQFCGLIMGDHTRCGINTMFNTGTVAGVGANIFGGDFKPKFIPSFSWSKGAGFSTYELDKFMETSEVVMNRRNKEMDMVEKDILTHIFEITAEFRNWEKDS